MNALPLDKYNWAVSHQMSLSTNLEKLWHIISSPSNLEFFHPFCAKNPVIQWPGLNSIDEVHYYNGKVYKRNFIFWEDLKGYDLLIGEKDGETSLVSWKIEDLGKDKSSLQITVYPHIFNTHSKVVDLIPFFLFIKPKLKKYLVQVIHGLEWHIKESQKIPKNHFGNHSWFSDNS